VDDAQPVVVNRRPDIAEATRVLSPIVLQRLNIIAYLVICALIGFIAGAAGATLLSKPAADAVTDWFFIIVGAFFIVGPSLLIVNTVRRRLASSIKDQPDVVTFSTTGIDTRRRDASAHYDWAAVVTGRTVPEGLILQIHRATAFISRREFDSDQDFERTLSFFRSALGPRFKG